jgi:transcriptional regulator with XRE-family HTH domain
VKKLQPSGLLFVVATSVSAVGQTGAPFVPAISYGGTSTIAAAVPSTTPQLSTGQRVRRVKERSGLTWAQLAAAVGVSSRSVHLWADGKPLRTRHLARLDAVEAAIESVGNASARDVAARLLGHAGGRPSIYSQLVTQHAPTHEDLVARMSGIVDAPVIHGVRLTGPEWDLPLEHS